MAWSEWIKIGIGGPNQHCSGATTVMVAHRGNIEPVWTREPGKGLSKDGTGLHPGAELGGQG